MGTLNLKSNYHYIQKGTTKAGSATSDNMALEKKHLPMEIFLKVSSRKIFPMARAYTNGRMEAPSKVFSSMASDKAGVS